MNANLKPLIGQRCYAVFRDGRQAIDYLTNNGSGDESDSYRFNDYAYYQNGYYLENRTTDCDIIDIRPASSVTLLKWITDRLPSRADADSYGRVQWLARESGSVHTLSYDSVAPGNSWAHTPDWTPPQPEPEPPATIEQRLADALKRIEVLEARLA